MKKSTLCAHLLVSQDGGRTLEQGERIVFTLFNEHFPLENFQIWNGQLNDGWCEEYLRTHPSPLEVDVVQFIQIFWDMT
ncbi:hypothetical protein GJ700_12540 [Duganella sp. FT92W]|uniref:Uncharacterized protein n=1 Tax=Pseudoduganella rivuli TaxID=2666085 RepID=A0A7X2IML8_9BURK|nr:hypothetical protein [Pseudoduganella rivuli]MRV72538.1 hypothetical protein [Pseudoduganella rivuli]